MILLTDHQAIRGPMMNDVAIKTATSINYDSVSELKSINSNRHGYQCHSISEIYTVGRLAIDIIYIFEENWVTQIIINMNGHLKRISQ